MHSTISDIGSVIRGKGQEPHSVSDQVVLPELRPAEIAATSGSWVVQRPLTSEPFSKHIDSTIFHGSADMCI
jgi:hypothetical protein